MKALPILLFLAGFFTVPTLPIASLQEMQRDYANEVKVYTPVHKAMEENSCSALANADYCMANAVREAKVTAVSRPGCAKVQHGIPSHVVSWNAKTRKASYVTFDQGFALWQADKTNVYTVRFCY